MELLGPADHSSRSLDTIATAMNIHEILDRDPLQVRLANNGQARITAGEDPRVAKELRDELDTFVCRGRFADALQRILERYLTNLDASRQDAVWVSGFFGSGKSHLLKMLAHLWMNTKFDDGATARSLVAGRLPAEVEHALRELEVHGRRIGKPLVAAAGSLLGGNVGHVRLSVLSILLRACGFPEQYPQARFCFWLRDNGLLDRVRGEVEATGRNWERELHNLYVSPVIAKALIDADPTFAADVKAARQLLFNQFPEPKADITTDQFVGAAKQALAPDGQLPLTILVLDEVQQYINEAQDRSATITELAEAVQTRFESRMLLVASGQSALSAGTKALQWLSDRFRIAIQLTDAEVEVVTREVLLQKKATATPAVKEMFEEHAGEVSRHLHGTRLAVRPEDQPNHVGDYPLLRTRRRFWEACFQTADPAGTQSQLRSQLRILHDSLQEIAKKPLGAVIPASDLFRALAPDLVAAGVLLNEIHTRIAQLDTDTPEGRLRADLCGVVFLIGKLPREGAVDLGVRSNAQTLSDLLVTDITTDSFPFRNRVADELEKLVAEGRLMKVADEYRIQTTEGADWERAFREQRTTVARNEVEIAARREQLLSGAVEEVVRRVRLVHGNAKLRRKVALHVNTDPDAAEGDAVRVWLRDEWSASWAQVRDEALGRGMEDPVLHVYLPKQSAEELRKHIVSAEAATRVLERRGNPASQEGQEARASMKSRLDGATAARDEIVRAIVRSARVVQGGGNEIYGEDLLAKLETGGNSSMARLFPRFPEGDHRAWQAAFKRARDGSGQPFAVLGWDGKVAEHTVSKRVLHTVGTGARGSHVRRTLESAPYGWPRDAVDATLVALHRNGHLKAERNGHPMATAELDQTAISKTRFRPEKVRLNSKQRVALRGLFGTLGVQTKSGEEELRAPQFLAAVQRLAANTGGDSPLPPVPDTRVVEDLSHLTGNEQLLAILKAKGEIEGAAKEWERLAARVEGRRTIWDRAVALRRHADGELEVADEVGRELDAVTEQRALLADTDHVSPCLAKLAQALRGELTDLHGQLEKAVAGASYALAGDPTWKKLDGPAQGAILGRLGLKRPAMLKVDTTEALKRTLDRRSLAGWRSEIDAVPERLAKALAEAAKCSEEEGPPVKYVKIQPVTLSNDADVQRWVAEHKTKLTKAVREGPVIVR